MIKVKLFNRRLRFTSMGYKYLLITLACGIVAINTGNNLVYVIFSLQLALIIASGVMSEINFLNLSIERFLPDFIYADNPFTVFVKVKNGKGYFPSYGLHISESSPDIKTSSKGYVLKIPVRGIDWARYEMKFPTRGLYALRKVTVTTTYPFGLFEKSMEKIIEDSVVVFPRVLPIDVESILGERWEDQGVGHKKGMEGSLRGLRDYLPEDDFRFIHWKAYAREQKLFFKEFDSEEEVPVTIVFDECLQDELNNNALFEKGVEVCASLAHNLVAQKKTFVQIITRNSTIPFGSDRRHLHRILTLLAVIKPFTARKPIGLGDLRYVEPFKDGFIITILLRRVSTLDMCVGYGKAIFVEDI
ncbi:MAG: DUF58 domain-containing protein [Thermodesulfobacteriota bacterium]|nr:DUF58 domain-containing protein [Thermodesulfobacteriota bacterium]